MQAFRTRAALGCQATAPEGSGAAPARAYVVLHEEAVLHHVGVGPNLLVRIAGHVGIGEEEVRVVDFIAARGPGRTVAGGTSYLGEECLAGLEVLGRSVAGGRHGQSAVPYHEVLVLLGGHFRIERLAGEVSLDVTLQVARVPFGMLLLGVDAADVLREACLYLGVLR